ncbi:esterase [soil metagenome]
MRSHHLQVRRTARYYTLGGDGDVGSVWFVLHGYAPLARYFIRPFEAIASDTRLIVAPEALNRYYFETAPGEHAADARVAATWMTREDREHEIEDYLEYLDALAERVSGDVASGTITVLGFSQGAATASRWAACGRTKIDRVVLWGASVAHELVPAPELFRGADLTVAVGNADPHVNEKRIAREHERLTGAGLDCTLLRYDGGHRIEADSLRMLVS